MAIIKVDVRFSDNVAELKDRIAAGTGAIEAMKQSVDRVAASMGGQGLFIQANRLTAAIDQLGGVTKLTTAEQERALATLDKAIDKYQIMGQTAPQAMVDLAASMRPVSDEADHTSERMENLKGALEHPLESAKSLASSFGTELVGSMGTFGFVATGVVAVVGAVGAGLMELGEHASETGAGLARLALVSDASVAGLSDFKFALDATGGATVDLDRVMFMFQQRMENNADKVSKGLELIGLSIADIIHLSPDQQMLRISQAFQDAGEGVNKSAAAFDIFGKQGREILPSLILPLSELAEKSKELGNTWTDVDAKAAHEFEIATATMAATAASAWTQLGRAVAPVTTAIALAYDRMKEAVANVALTAADAVGGIGTLINAMMALSPLGNDSSIAMERLAGELPKVASSAKGLADGSGLAAKGVKDWKDQMKEYSGAAPTYEQAIENEKELTRDLDTETRKHIDSMNKSIEAQAKYRDQVTGNVKADADQVAVLQTLTSGLVVGEATYNRVRDAIGALLDKGLQVPVLLKDWYERNLPVLQATHDFSGYLGELTDRASGAAESMYNLAASTNEFKGGITIAGDELHHTTIPLFTTLARDILPQNTKAINDARHANDDAWGGRTQGMLKDAGAILRGVHNEIAQIAETAIHTGEAIFKNLADGNIWGAAVAGVTGAITMISQLFGGVSKDVQDARKAVDNFEQSIHATLTATQLAEAGGESWKMTVIGIRDAFLATGRSEADAMAAADALWRSQASGSAAAKAEIDQLNAVLNEQKQDAADLDAAVKKYGFSIEQLGPAMQKQQLDAQALTLLNDWRLLIGAGIDMTIVNDKMSGSMNDYLATARKTGQEVPIAMQPIIQKMIDQGLLTDENGNKITEMKDVGVTFSETMTAGFDKVVAKLQELLNKIGMVPAALNTIPIDTNIDVNLNAHWNIPAMPSGNDPIYPSTGGLVTSHGLQYFGGGGNVLPFLARGTDIVPAMLTPGEGVVSTTGMARLGSDGLRALNGGGGSNVIDFDAMRSELAALRKDQAQQAAQAARDRAEFPRAIARAMRDANAGGGRR